MGEGSAIIYTYARNGLYKTVTVTVTPARAIPNTVEAQETEVDALSVEAVEPTDDERTDIELDDVTVEKEIIDSTATEADVIPEDDAIFIDWPINPTCRGEAMSPRHV